MRTPTVSGGPGVTNTGSRVADHPHPSIMGRAAEKLNTNYHQNGRVTFLLPKQRERYDLPD